MDPLLISDFTINSLVGPTNPIKHLVIDKPRPTPC